MNELQATDPSTLNGVILLTGPSGCGKGEIAKALDGFLQIPENRRLSMGSILRNTLEKADTDSGFRTILSGKFGISDTTSIFDPQNNKPEIIRKALTHINELRCFFCTSGTVFSQLDWLRFCVQNGLLVPDEWTEKIIEALLENTPGIKKGVTILDGYPRTVAAAEHLLETLDRLELSVVKVLHLIITKEEMRRRALGRKRTDDTCESLERRYQFYIDKVQPCIDYMKNRLGGDKVALIDAHQPVMVNGRQDIEASIQKVAESVMRALDLPDRF